MCLGKSEFPLFGCLQLEFTGQANHPIPLMIRKKSPTQWGDLHQFLQYQTCYTCIIYLEYIFTLPLPQATTVCRISWSSSTGGAVTPLQTLMGCICTTLGSCCISSLFCYPQKGGWRIPSNSGHQKNPDVTQESHVRDQQCPPAPTAVPRCAISLSSLILSFYLSSSQWFSSRSWVFLAKLNTLIYFHP